MTIPIIAGEVILVVRANPEKRPKYLIDAKTSTKKAAEQMESDITDSMEHAAKETKPRPGPLPAAPAAADGIAAVRAGEISCFQIGVGRKDDICLYLRFHHPKVPSPALPGLN